MDNTQQPLISVDVVPLQLDRDSGEINVVLGRRLFEPFIHELALPGVLLTHELVKEAASRALREKVSVDVSEAAVLDAGVFDNPDRDPRGPTLAIAHAAVLAPGATIGERGVPTPLQNVSGLPFDHDSIVRAGAAALLAALWRDKDITRQALGETFSSRDAGCLQRALTTRVDGAPAELDAANLARRIAKSGWVQRLPDTGKPAASGGRPPAMWKWL